MQEYTGKLNEFEKKKWIFMISCKQMQFCLFISVYLVGI